MSEFKIAIIPGHRPRAKGAYSPHINQYEYEYNEDLAIKLVNKINKINLGIKAQLILRPNDEMSEHQALNLLCQTVKKSKVNYAIELHCNSASSITANGAEVLIFAGTSSENKTAALVFLKLITKVLANRKRGVKLISDREQAGHHFLRGVPCPAIILEPGFFSNLRESCLLLDRKEYYLNALFEGCLYLKEIFKKKGEE